MLNDEKLTAFRSCPPYKAGIGLQEPVAINDQNNNGNDNDRLTLLLPTECPGSTALLKVSVFPSLTRGWQQLFGRAVWRSSVIKMCKAHGRPSNTGMCSLPCRGSLSFQPPWDTLPSISGVPVKGHRLFLGKQPLRRWGSPFCLPKIRVIFSVPCCSHVVSFWPVMDWIAGSTPLLRIRMGRDKKKCVVS